MVTIAAAICAFAIHAAHLAPWCPSIGDEAIAVVDEGRRLGRHASSFGTTSFFYDALNRLVSRTADGEKEEFSYDATGLLLSASNSVAFETFTYDQCGRLSGASTLIGQNTYNVAYLRDGGGISTNISYGTGMSVSREYDADGRLVRVRDWLGHEWTFSYDGEGKPIGGASPDGRAHSFSYDAAGRLSSWSVAGMAGRSLERDAAGRLMRETVTAGAMPRPAKERRAHNTFDAAGRIVSADVECGAGESVHEVYLHDSCGAVTNVSADGETVFAASYDAQGRLASLGGPPSSAAAFSYDALGNRIHANGRMFIPDHDDPLKRPLLECDDAGVPVRAYIWGAGRLLGWLDFESASSGGPRSGAANGRAASPLAAAESSPSSTTLETQGENQMNMNKVKKALVGAAAISAAQLGAGSGEYQFIISGYPAADNCHSDVSSGTSLEFGVLSDVSASDALDARSRTDDLSNHSPLRSDKFRGMNITIR